MNPLLVFIIIITIAAATSESVFQIQSTERKDLCIEVFKTLDQVGRLWLQKCKSKSDIGMDRQMFSVTNDGKLHPSTKTSSCIFLYNNKSLRYRKDCVGILHQKKNQWMYHFFDGNIFRMGDVSKVMTVSKLEEKKEIKLQKGLSSKIAKERWTLLFEIDSRVLDSDDDNIWACDQTTSPMPSGKYPPSPKSTHMPTKPPMPSGKYPTSPTSNAPTKALPTKPPILLSPTTYPRIRTGRDFNLYVYIWLVNNMEDAHPSYVEKDLYRQLVHKHG